MNITKLIFISALGAALATVPALARGRGPGGGGRGLCPYGNVPGSGICNGSGAGTARGDALGAGPRGNPNSTGTPLRDGSRKATAPGRGPKDGTGNNPRHPAPAPQP